MPGQRFSGLDGLRGTAALSVLLFHGDGLFRPAPVLMHGYLAVDLFFVLSGFVIALTYERRLKEGLPFRIFVRNRGLRLLPIYWCGLFANAAALLSVGHPPAPTDVLREFFLVPQTAHYGYAFVVCAVAWTLFCEWIVNIAYAAGLFRMRTRALLAIAAFGWGIMTVAGFLTHRGFFLGESSPDVFVFGMLRAVPAFCIGVAIFRAHDRAWFARLPVVMPEILYGIWLLVAVVPTPNGTPLFDSVAVIGVCPALIVLLVRSEARAGAWCLIAGRLSYPLYVSHLAVVIPAQNGLHLFARGNLLAGGCAVAAALLLAWAIAAANDRLQSALRRLPVFGD